MGKALWEDADREAERRKEKGEHKEGTKSTKKELRGEPCGTVG